MYVTTRLTVCLGERLRRPVRRVMSCRNDFAEQLSETNYNKLVGLQLVEVEVGYVRPLIRPAIGIYCRQSILLGSDSIVSICC